MLKYLSLELADQPTVPPTTGAFISQVNGNYCWIIPYMTMKAFMDDGLPHVSFPPDVRQEINPWRLKLTW